MAPKINKRLIVLLTIMVVLWGVAIFTLINLNRPTPQNNPPSRTETGSAGQAIGTTQTSAFPSGMSQVNPPETSQATTTEESGSKPITLPTESELLESSNVDFLSPYCVDLSYLNAFYGDLPNLTGTSLQIDDVTSRDFQYVGYISIKNGPISIKKIFLLLNGDYVSGFENELIAGRYKPIRVFSTYMIFLDTLDGKIKKVGYLGE